MPRITETLVELMKRRGWLHITEVVEKTGHGRSTIYDWAERGQLPTTRSGGHMFFERRALEELCPQILIDPAMPANPKGGRGRERRA